MAYILNKTDGTALVTVANNSTTGSDYSVTFIGKNYLPYGETLNESLLHLLENSASVAADRPENPVVGQTWYNKSNNTLNVCYQERVGISSARFRTLAHSNSGSFAPSDPNIGDLWFDISTEKLKVYLGVGGWRVIGPAPQADWAQTDSTQLDYIKNRPTAFTANLTILNKGSLISTQPTSINFTGDGVAATLISGTNDSIVVNIPGATSNNNTVSIGSSAPPSPTAGQLWYENASIGRGFIYDGVQWVDFSPAIGGGTSTPSTAPTSNIPIAASTSFTLATTDGSAKSMGVVLTPGTWQVILDTRLTTKNDYNHDATMTQIAKVGSVTVTTEIKTNRGGGAGHGRSSLGSSDIAVGEFTLLVDTPLVMSMEDAVPGDAGMQLPVGSTLTVTKIAATDAQKIYSGTMPTFTPPSASGLGVGQTWKTVTSNRVSNTPYTNSTGAPIMVALSFYLRQDLVATVEVGSVMVLKANSPSVGNWLNLTFVVPNNTTYRVTENGWLDVIWTELRQ
jgi:hypothetical protein